MSFQNCVKSILGISECLQVGLQALGSNSTKIQPGNSRSLNGSVALDDCLSASLPNDPRWDYVLGYNEKAYFVEVHPASGQVTQVINKVNWLRNWLKKDGAALAEIHADGNFHWIPTNGVKIIGKQRLVLSTNKIVVKSVLAL